MSPPPTDPLLSHEYDGIREYDNPTPAWWNWMFIGTIIFSALYVVYYHLGSGTSVARAYQEEIEHVAALRAEEARAAARGLDEDVIARLMTKPESVAEGKAKYDTVCAACHGFKGEGLIGPNLTDAYWIHGHGTLMDIHKVVTEGVVEKGMVAWGNQMAPELLLEVVSYVGTLRGQNVAGKAPQGNKVDNPSRN